MKRPSLGLCSVTFRALSYSEVLMLAREAAVEGIEWGADVHVPPGDTARAHAVASATRACGIAIASYGSYVEAGSSDRLAFEHVLDTAVALEAPNIRVWAGRRGVPSSSVSGVERQRCADDLRAYAALAAPAGVSIALEFHRETLTDTLASTVDLLTRVDHPNLFTYWQPRPGIGGTDAADELQELRPWLSHLHVFNWNAQRERFPLADSAAFWTPLFERLAHWDDDRVSRRWAMIEFVRNDDPQRFAEDARVLRGWLDASSTAQSEARL